MITWDSMSVILLERFHHERDHAFRRTFFREDIPAIWVRLDRDMNPELIKKLDIAAPLAVQWLQKGNVLGRRSRYLIAEF